LGAREHAPGISYESISWDSLVAGYRTSGTASGPGFAWYFGRDSFWTSAPNAEGDFSTARAALDFLGKYQREDGKIPHEIAQGASFGDWFKDYRTRTLRGRNTLSSSDERYVVRAVIRFRQEKMGHSLIKRTEILALDYDEQASRRTSVWTCWSREAAATCESELYQTAVSHRIVAALANLGPPHGREAASKIHKTIRAAQKPRMNEAFGFRQEDIRISLDTTIML